MIYAEYVLEDCEDLNSLLFDRFTSLRDAGKVHGTHYFAGRFENSCIERQDLPELSRLFDFARQQAAELLDMPAGALREGFWFNAMEPGNRTMEHHHDENEELLSAVYYIRVPPDSGELVLYQDDVEYRVQPQEGKLVMFPPHVSHEVTTNNSTEMRLSVAMNFGPVAAA